MSPSCYCAWAKRDHHMFFHPLPGHWVCHTVGVCHPCTHSQGPCCQPARGQKAHRPASEEALYFHMKQNWSTLLLVPPPGAGRAVGGPGPLEAPIRPVPRPCCLWEAGPGRGRSARRKCQGISDGGRQGGRATGGFSSRTRRKGGPGFHAQQRPPSKQAGPQSHRAQSGSVNQSKAIWGHEPP